jgi:prepilin-type N-terminal cleavage/methylation domain-containing protein
MKTLKTTRKTMTRNRRDRGFTLVEMLVAGAVFALICGAALSLFATHAPLFNKQQNLAALNIQIRNAVSQLQLDTINAGSGYYQGINIPDFPVGLTIENHTATPCNVPATFTYGPNCFDQLNIIAVDPSTPPAHPTDIGANCVSSTSAILFANPIAPTTTAQLAADFHTGDQLLLVSSDGSQMTAVTLTKDGSVSGAKVQLQHNPTGADGTNAADPAFITTNPNNKLGTTFCNADWILKISPITYKVDTSTPSDPKLIREQPSGSNNDVVVAEQIIGFKVGAITWNSCNGGCTSDDGSTYNYDSSTYTSGGVAQAYNFSLIRSVQMELIGRTNPNPDPSYVYRNGFDKGPYQIQSVSIVVNPRNLTMSNH